MDGRHHVDDVRMHHGVDDDVAEAGRRRLDHRFRIRRH